MIKKLCFLIMAFVCVELKSQTTNILKLDSIKAPLNLEINFVKPLYQDSVNVSSFLIFIKNEVKPHKHLAHDEQVYVLEGEGIMQLGETSAVIKKGDFIFIPKNTFHSVVTTPNIPLKVISIQAPYFDGKDRMLKQQ